VPCAGSERYADCLLVRRGLAAETVRGYCNTARAFLADREQVVGDLALGGLDVAVINDYLLGRSRRGSISPSKAVVTGLRSLLRFLYSEGLIRSRPRGRRRAGGQLAAGVAGQGA
jgi:site-specific recombinase XerD